MKGRIKQWIGYCIMLIGLGFLVGPFVMGIFESRKQQEVVKEFNSIAKREKFVGDFDGNIDSTDTSNSNGDSNTGGNDNPDNNTNQGEKFNPYDTNNKNMDEFLRKAISYNQKLSVRGQDSIKGLSDLENFGFSALDYGYAENIFGTLYIPRLEVELGMYLGASKDNMANGFAIFGNTSLPTGMLNENSAIAGHRGWRGTPVLRDIQNIQMGDPIYVTNYWDTLVYRVCEIRIVPNDDNDWFKIQDGRCLITLMTCHPYHENYQRYLVFAELSEEDMPSREEIKRINEETYDPSPKKVLQINEDGSSEIVYVESKSIEPDGTEYGAVWSNYVILAENKLKILAYVMCIVVLIIGIVLGVGTAKDIKQKGETNNGSQE